MKMPTMCCFFIELDGDKTIVVYSFFPYFKKVNILLGRFQGVLAVLNRERKQVSEECGALSQPFF